VLEVLGDGPRADVHRPGDGEVGPALRGHLQHLQLAVGEVGQAVVGFRCHRGPGPLSVARPPQRLAQLSGHDAQQRAVGLGEVGPGPVEGDAFHPAVALPRQGEGDLVLYRNMPEKLRVKSQSMKFLTIEKVAYLDRLAIAHDAEVGEKRMLIQMGLESRESGRVHRLSRIFGVIRSLIGHARNLVICDDIGANKCGQAGQGDLGHLVRPVRVIQVGEAVDELHGLLERVQRNIHMYAPPSFRSAVRAGSAKATWPRSAVPTVRYTAAARLVTPSLR
jgi:hypothetical protein